MVGGLVEEKKLRFLDEKAREMGAHDPAAAESFRRPIEIRFAKGEPRQDTLCLGLELPAAMLVKGMERFVMFRRIFRRGFQDPLRFGQFGRNRTRSFQDGLVARRSVFLGQKPHGRRFLQRHLAFVG